MSKEQNLYDEEWIDKLDLMTMKAFNCVRDDAELRGRIEKEVMIEATRVVRRAVKQKGHVLTPPEAADLTNAIMEVRWILDKWEPVLGGPVEDDAGEPRSIPGDLSDGEGG
jgi:hypothetical protein